MNRELEILKGAHPGWILEKKLKEKNWTKGRFALSIDEYPQTITAITKAKRGMNTTLALKAEHALGLDEGYFMILQVFYDIKQEKKKRKELMPPMPKVRKALFWDTNIDNIDWDRHAAAVIRRIFERGNEQEKEEIRRYYGAAMVDKALNKNPSD